MSSSFFTQAKPRHQNPTFLSHLVHSAMIFPSSKYQLIRNADLQTKKLKEAKSAEPQISSNKQVQNPENNSQASSSNCKTNSSSSSLALQEPGHRRSKSQLFNYGSSSLKNLQRICDKDVFQKQQKPYNILSLCPQQYKQTIKVFPKLRNQIKQDSPHLTRNAFISGKPEVGLSYSRLLQQSLSLTQNENRLTKNDKAVINNIL